MMKTVIVLIEYPESDWCTDLVAFSLPDGISDSTLMDTLQEINTRLFKDEGGMNSQEQSKKAIVQTSQALNSSWEFVHQADVLEILDC